MRPYHNIVNPVSESSNNAFCTADQSQSVVAASRGPMDDTARNNSAVNNRVKPLPGTIAHDFSIDMFPLSGGCPTREFFHNAPPCLILTHLAVKQDLSILSSSWKEEES